MEDIAVFVAKFQKLNINQQQLVVNIVDKIAENQSNDKGGDFEIINDNSTNQTRIVNHNFIGSEGTPLAIGDQVEILTSRKTGRKGVTAQIMKFNKTYVTIKLEKNRNETQQLHISAD